MNANNDFDMYFNNCIFYYILELMNVFTPGSLYLKRIRNFSISFVDCFKYYYC